MRFAIATVASLLFPFAPHLGAEVYERVTGERVWEEPWPEADPALLASETVKLVVQVNGKVVDRIEAPAEASREELKRIARASEGGSAPRRQADREGGRRARQAGQLRGPMSTPEPRSTPLPVGVLVASIGAVMLIVSLFLDWYHGVTGFTVYEFLDLLLVLLALATIASLVGGLGVVQPARAPGIALAVSIFTVSVVASQLVNDPPAVAGAVGPGKDIGIWLALGGSVLMVAGALLSYAPHLAERGDAATLTYVAVIGPGDEPIEAAAEVGRLLAERGAVVVCGGLGGTMEAACRGAKQAGGTTVGLLPGGSRSDANPFVDVAIPTGLGEARNALVVRAADVVVAVGGGYGTLSEIALALKAGKRVVGLGSWEIDGVVATDGPEAAVAEALS